MYIGFRIQCPLFLSGFSETLIFKTFAKNTQISKLTKIHSLGTEMFHANGGKDRHDEANSRFSQFRERA